MFNGSFMDTSWHPGVDCDSRDSFQPKEERIDPNQLFLVCFRNGGSGNSSKDPKQLTFLDAVGQFVVNVAEAIGTAIQAAEERKISSPGPKRTAEEQNRYMRGDY